MKRLLNLFLAVVFTIHTPFSFADDDTSYSDSTPDTFSNSDTGDRDDNATNADPLGTSVDDMIGSGVTDPAWGESLYNPSTNPILAALLGQPATSLSETSLSQSFGALLISNPVALFLDLNGNGVRGDMWDGLLFNLFWGGQHNSMYTTSNFENGVQARFTGAAQRADFVVMRSRLSDRNVLLVAPMSDGRRAAPIANLIQLVELESSNAIRGDQMIALSTLTLLALANPLATTKYGPFLRSSSTNVTSIAENIRKDIAYAIVSANFHSGGNRLALDASVSRLAAIVAMVEAFAKRQYSAVEREETLLALRGALYFMAFEIKRLKMDARNRDYLFKSLIQTLAKNAPHAMRLAAERATSPEEMANLMDLVRYLPVVNTPLEHHRKLRVAVSLVASGVALALWMKGAAPQITNASGHSFVGVAGAAIGGIGASSGAAIFANWLLKPKRIGVLDPSVRAFYESIICESELIR